MFLRDTNIQELLVQGDRTVTQHVAENPGSVYLSSVAAEEFVAGRLSAISRARSARTSLSLPQAHEEFVVALEYTQVLPAFACSDAAEQVFRAFPPATVRIGPQDCRVAAQALAHGLTVVTRNVRDFAAIGARGVDWSAPNSP